MNRLSEARATRHGGALRDDERSLKNVSQREIGISGLRELLNDWDSGFGEWDGGVDGTRTRGLRRDRPAF